MKKVLTVALCLLLCVALLNCAKKKEEAPKTEAQQVAPLPDIISLAMSDGRFTTLVKAIEAAGLVDTLKSEGPFTVFAPTDSAFMKLPPGTVDGLLGDIPTLRNLLLYHVVVGKMMAADIALVKKLGSAAGDSITVTGMPDGKVMVNDANVIQADVNAKNGVIHAIDKVIMPPSKTPPAKPAKKGHK
jgi:uncharacterized surface protein with fasciclin (FAS1) repeats